MEEAETKSRGARRWRWFLLLFLLVLTAGLAGLWLSRVSLVSSYVDRELQRRGVRAEYEIRRIGFGTQILENLVIGDPARPDATARRVEVEIRIGLTGPEVGLIRARGVRMFGRLRDGRLTLGDIDRLLPPPSGLPFRLPDQRVDLDEAAIALDTPAGLVAIALSGRGNLADGFAGRAAIASNRLMLGECRTAPLRANFAVRTEDLRPFLDGPLALAGLDCGTALRIGRMESTIKVAASPGIDRWDGEALVRTGSLRSGPQRLGALEGRLSFAGGAGRTGGRFSIHAADASFEQATAQRLNLAGIYSVSPRTGALRINGEASADGLRVAQAGASGAAALLRSAAGTPFGPIGEKLAASVERAARGGARAVANLQLASGAGYGAVRLAQLGIDTQGGARLRADGGKGLTYHWTGGALRLDGNLLLSGGGFPDVRMIVEEAELGGSFRGLIRIAPMRAGNARLALGDIRLAARNGETRFSTSLVADGPIGDDGRVSGLTVPLSGSWGRNGLRLGEDCISAAFQSLQAAGLVVGSTRLPFCPTGPALLWQDRAGRIRAGAELRAPRLAGRIGQSPLRLGADRVRIDLQSIMADSLSARLGPPDSETALDMDRIGARFAPSGLVGTYSGLSGRIAHVPLAVSGGEGEWRLLSGDLRVEGRLQVADQQQPPRFHPLRSEDFVLELDGDRIEAAGWLLHPGTGRQVAQARIEHRLNSGAGHALLDVPALAFGPDFQPEALTPLTVGVVALVEGTLHGQGRIEWDGDGTRSTGTFATDDMNLAAPFGPVEGLSTEIRFTDLLGLVSAPGQIAQIDLVQPGIDVLDGRIAYQLRPNYHVAIETARWPYAGGELFLDPTVLDFSQPSTKYLTFRVVGLDAARFVSQMEFGNISATGTFDGVIPMQFDIRGGRIVGGRLGAREQGGTLSYIGELTDRDLGIYGKMAFDALKALTYDRFDMTLDGALDGEFATRIDLDGIARDPSGPVQVPGGAIGQMIAQRVIRQIGRIPFQFNIRIQGPFRALLATAGSFEDPTLLIQPALPQLLRDQPTEISDVQDEESENEP